MMASNCRPAGFQVSNFATSTSSPRWRPMRHPVVGLPQHVQRRLKWRDAKPVPQPTSRPQGRGCSDDRGHQSIGVAGPGPVITFSIHPERLSLLRSHETVRELTSLSTLAGSTGSLSRPSSQPTLIRSSDPGIQRQAAAAQPHCASYSGSNRGTPESESQPLSSSPR